MAQLTIKVNKSIVTEPIDEFGISLLDFLKKKHNVVIEDCYIMAIEGIYQAPNFRHGFWAIFINNNLAVWKEKDLPYITCLKDKSLPSYPAKGAGELILKEGSDIKLEFVKLLSLSSIQLQALAAPITVVNGDVIRVSFTLENTGPITTDYYIYLYFDEATFDVPRITYGPFRNQLTVGEVKLVSQDLYLSGFTIDRKYDLTVSAQYPNGSELAQGVETTVIYVLAGGSEQGIIPSDDSYVFNLSPDTNRGDSSSLKTTYSFGEIQDIYMKFLIPNVAINSAQLRLYVEHVGSGQGGDVLIAHLYDVSWSEGTINWNNAPPLGGSGDPLLEITKNLSVGDGYWITADITPFANAHKGENVTIFLTCITEGVNARLSSKEGTNPPVIQIS